MSSTLKTLILKVIDKRIKINLYHDSIYKVFSFINFDSFLYVEKNVKQQKPTHWYVILTLVYQIDWIFYKRITSIPFTMSYAKKLCHWLFIYYLSSFIQIRVSNRFEQDMYTFCYKKVYVYNGLFEVKNVLHILGEQANSCNKGLN